MSLQDLVSYASDRIIEILQHLFPQNDWYQKQYDIRGVCPIHGGDNKSAFSLLKQSGKFWCFTHGCHEKYKISDIFTLTSIVRKCDRRSSVTHIAKFIGYQLDQIDDEIDSSISQVYSFLNNKKFKKKLNNATFTQSVLDQLDEPPYEWFEKKRGISSDVVKKYKIGYCSNKDKYLYGSIIFPVWDIQNKIVGFTARRTSQSLFTSKWYHKCFKKNYNIYNIHEVYQDIKKHQYSVILCQGPMDVLKFEQAGIHNSLAIFGDRISDEQINVLLCIGILELKLALDMDQAGEHGMQSIFNKCSDTFDVSELKIPVAYNDVGQMPSHEIIRMVEQSL